MVSSGYGIARVSATVIGSGKDVGITLVIWMG
jgi:hypothetical protein